MLTGLCQAQVGMERNHLVAFSWKLKFPVARPSEITFYLWGVSGKNPSLFVEKVVNWKSLLICGL